MSDADVIEQLEAEPATSSTTPAVPDGTGGGDSGVNPAAGGGDAVAEQDWRTEFYDEGDDKTKQVLDRYTDKKALASAFMETRTALRSKQDGMVKIPGDDAKEEDVAAFNKTIGVPETKDGYTDLVAPPAGLELGAEDNAFLDQMRETLHKKGGFLATPDGVNAARQFYFDMLEEQVATKAAFALQQKEATDRELSQMWGSEKKINMTFAGEAITSLFDVDSPDEVLQIELADGTVLGNNSAFMRAMAKAGRNVTEDPAVISALVSGETMTESSVDEQIKQIKDKRLSDPKEYAKLSAPGGKLMELMARKERFQR